MSRSRVAPQIRRHVLHLKARKLHHQSRIAEHRDGLRKVNEQLAELKPPKPNTSTE